jgi:hypothetical protein
MAALLTALVGLFVAFWVGRWWQSALFSDAGLLLFAASALYFLIQMIGRLCLCQWWGGLWAFTRLSTCILAMIASVLFTMFAAMFGPSEDGFAKGLTIPSDMEVASPLAEPRAEGTSEDIFQAAMLAALKMTPNNDASLSPALPALRILAPDHRPLLMRYLSSHPAWRVFEENNALYATRRWQKGGMWLMNLHGNYSAWDFGQEKTPNFQSRTTIGLSGKTWIRTPIGDAWMDEGTAPRKVALRKDNGLDESYCVVRCGDVVIELVEQSAGTERRLSKAALTVLESEFKSLLEKKAWSSDVMPAGSTRTGKPVLNLYNGMQPGIYNVESWLNPGEPGTVYIRAYEVTRKTRLSEDRLYERSNERIGWSGNPQELFLYNTEITIYEGDWGQPYAARFELWLKPESGAVERKLLERNFKIEGWQR